MKLVSIVLLTLLSGVLVSNASDSSTTKERLVARYGFDEYSGERVADTSGNGLDGVVIGSAQRVDGVRGMAISFDGLNRINVAPFQATGISTLLNLDDQMTLTAWVKGRGGEFRLVRPPSSYPSIRGPDLQVCGDVIHLTFNSDHPSRENPKRQGDYYKGPWNDWQVWTGTVDINLSNWRDQQRTHPPFSGVEPKLVVYGGQSFYEYFGQDANGVWQIYTAQSNSDGSGWRTTQRTFRTEGYRTEQLFNLQVASGRIHYAWEEKGDTDQWQMWAASSALDGSDFKAVQHTFDGGGIPQLQIVGDKKYYLYSTPASDSRKPYRVSATFAVSKLDGSCWRVLKTIQDIPYWYGGIGAFQVSNNRIYLTYNRAAEDGHIHLFTGEMNTEGQDFRSVQRTFGKENSGIPQGGGGIQVVGDKIYYIFQLDNGRFNIEERYAALRSSEQTNTDISDIAVWTAVSDLNGSNWKATKRTGAPPSILLGYQGIQVIGGKAYYAGFESPPTDHDARERGDRYRAVLGTSGSNIINKGDAFGLGLDEFNELSGFINAGQDYLYRGEAPVETSGAVAHHSIDNQWHFVVMTYDGTRVKLYADGELRASKAYERKAGRNPFPLTIGDGFNGIIDEVSIYNHVVTSKEISEWYKEGMATLKN